MQHKASLIHKVFPALTVHDTAAAFRTYKLTSTRSSAVMYHHRMYLRWPPRWRPRSARQPPCQSCPGGTRRARLLPCTGRRRRPGTRSAAAASAGSRCTPRGRATWGHTQHWSIAAGREHIVLQRRGPKVGVHYVAGRPEDTTITCHPSCLLVAQRVCQRYGLPWHACFSHPSLLLRQHISYHEHLQQTTRMTRNVLASWWRVTSASVAHQAPASALRNIFTA